MKMKYWKYLFYIMLVLIHLAIDSLADIGVDQQSCIITSDLEDQCGFVCYPIVKPLLQYLARCQEKDVKINQLEEKVREQRVDIIKYKSETEALDKQLEKNFCDQKSVLKQALDDVQKVQSQLSSELKHLQPDTNSTELVDGVDLRQEIEELKLDLKSKEAVIHFINYKLTQKHEILLQREKTIKELEEKEHKELEYIKQMWEKYFPRNCENFDSSANFLTIHVPEAEPFSVICDSKIPGSGWAIVLRELEGSDSLDQKLHQYKEKPFGDLHSSFFIGRKNLYLMTREIPYEVHATVEFRNGFSKIYQGNKLDVGDETENYAIKSFNSRIAGYSKQQARTSASLAALFNKKFLPFDDLNDWEQLIIMIRETV